MKPHCNPRYLKYYTAVFSKGFTEQAESRRCQNFTLTSPLGRTNTIKEPHTQNPSNQPKKYILTSYLNLKQATAFTIQIFKLAAVVDKLTDKHAVGTLHIFNQFNITLSMFYTLVVTSFNIKPNSTRSNT